MSSTILLITYNKVKTSYRPMMHGISWLLPFSAISSHLTAYLVQYTSVTLAFSQFLCYSQVFPSSSVLLCLKYKPCYCLQRFLCLSLPFSAYIPSLEKKTLNFSFLSRHAAYFLQTTSYNK